MTDGSTPAQRAQAEAQRRRRLAEIFGDVIPEQTSDDSEPDDPADRRTDEKAQEEWLKRQVPPHHG
jgi:alpha-ketoglutarate-dependent taurine dioxygenase